MKKIIVIFILSIFFWGCGGTKRIHTDPIDEEFYNKTRFIMTKEEKEIYNHLPDRKSKEQFIIEFWKKRDPDPETEENESKMEYERRIVFANSNFRDRKAKGMGWSTDRGRILLHLGFPDYVNPIVTTYPGTTSQVEAKVWYYHRYQLRLVFMDRSGFGQFKLQNWPTRLLTYIERAKNVFNIHEGKSLKHKFKFNMDYKEKNIAIKVPVEKIQFEESGQIAKAEFTINIHVFKDYQRIDTIKKKKVIEDAKENILKKDSIDILIPYNIREKGIYHIEAIIEEVSTSTRYRVFHKVKR